MKASMAQGQRNKEMDILRVFSILYIVAFWHLHAIHNQFTDLFIHCVLGLFMYISGYLASFGKEYTAFGSVVAYYRNRFFRIYPLFFAFLTIFLSMGIIGSGTYLKSVLMTNMFLREPLLTLWFVTLLCLLYAIAPCVLYRYTPFKTVCFAGGLWTVLVILHFSSDFIDPRLPMYLIPFMTGILAGRQGLAERVTGHDHHVLVCLSVFLLTFWLYSGDETFADLLIIETAILSTIPLFSVLARYLAILVPAKPVQCIAYASFVMYLSHRIFYTLSGELYTPSSTAGKILYYACAVVPVLVVASYWIQSGYDRILSMKPSGARG